MIWYLALPVALIVGELVAAVGVLIWIVVDSRR